MNIFTNQDLTHPCEDHRLFGLVSSQADSSWQLQRQPKKETKLYRRLRKFSLRSVFWWPIAGLVLLFTSLDFTAAQTLAEDRLALVRMLNDAERALSARNAARFLSYFDNKNSPDYFRIETHVVALTRQAYIASSISVSDWTSNNNGYSGTVDWLLQLTLVSSPSKIETRRTNVQVSVVRSMKNKNLWKIKAVTPVDFFRPL